MAGVLFDRVGISAPFAVSGVLMVVALMAVWSITRPAVVVAQ
jgi:hypothetical protein